MTDHPSLDEEVAIATSPSRHSYHLVDPEAPDDADDQTLCGNPQSSTTMPLRRALRCGGIDDPETDLCAVCAATSDDIEREWTDIANSGQQLQTTTCPHCDEPGIPFGELGNHIEHHCPEAPEPPDDDEGISSRRWVG